MTMRERDLSKMPADTEAVGHALLPESHPLRVIGEHLADIVADQAFADLYEDRGRGAIPPSILALVTILQFLEKVPDRQAAEMVVFRLDWKFALRLPLDYAGFNYTDLHYFRQRIVDHEQEELVFNTILAKVKALGFIKKRGKQRTDSLAIVGAVQRLSVYELVNETLRVVIHALEKADPGWVSRVLPEALREYYARMKPEYKLTDQERQEALLKAGKDGFWLLVQIDQSGSKTVKELPEVETMRRVWDQRFKRVAGSEGPSVVYEESADSKELIVSPHDPGVRAGQKRGEQWHGDKAHVTETCDEGQPRFITDVTTSNATSGDGEALPGIREHLADREVSPGRHYTDAGYVSGTQMAKSEGEGIILMGPPLEDTSPNKFKIDDFSIDREARQATCPEGKTSVKWTNRTERDGSVGVNIYFAVEDCQACRYWGECATGSKSGRSLHIGEHHERLMARRAEAKTEAFKAEMKVRAGIEATLSELVRGHGFRRHRYRGDQKRHFENLLKAAACNLKRLVRALLARWEGARQQAAKAVAGLGEGKLVAMASG